MGLTWVLICISSDDNSSQFSDEEPVAVAAGENSFSFFEVNGKWHKIATDWQLLFFRRLLPFFPFKGTRLLVLSVGNSLWRTTQKNALSLISNQLGKNTKGLCYCSKRRPWVKEQKNTPPDHPWTISHMMGAIQYLLNFMNYAVFKHLTVYTHLISYFCQAQLHKLTLYTIHKKIRISTNEEKDILYHYCCFQICKKNTLGTVHSSWTTHRSYVCTYLLFTRYTK